MRMNIGHTKIIIILLNLLPLPLRGGILGSFEKIQNLPGYIDLRPKSPWYKDVVKRSRDEADGIERRTPSEILDDYFANGHLDQEKVANLIADIRYLKNNAFIVYCTKKLPAYAKDNTYCLGEVQDQELLKKWQKSEVNLTLQYAEAELQRTISLGQNLKRTELNEAKSEEFLDSFFSALEIYETMKGEDRQRGKLTGNNVIVAEHIPNLFISVKYKIKEGRPEAANLLVPENLKSRYSAQRFLSLRDIKILEKNGFDLSTLEPADSGMWRKPQRAVHKFDVTRYNNEDVSFLKKTMTTETINTLKEPKSPINLVYIPDKFKGGATAKLYAKIGNDKWKVKFLTDKVGSINTTNLLSLVEMLLNAAEVNVEDVVNNLAAAIGYTVDPTYYKEKVRLFFPDEIYEKNGFEEAYKQMIEQIESCFDKSMYIRSAMQNVKVDPATGKKYIEIRGVNLEKKSDRKTDINIGFFVRHGLGKSLKREHRAFALFLAWIADLDPKNENVTTKLIPSRDEHGQPVYRIAYSNSDMGAALGGGLPNYFPKTFITDYKYDHGHTTSLEFEYRKIYSIKIQDAITLNDAKWLARRIAQFTPCQLKDAFLAAGFPPLVAEVFAGKLMGRRNQLIEALGMLGETVIDDEGQSISIQREPEFGENIPGYERFFKDGLLTDENNELYDPERESFPRHWGAFWNRKVDDAPQTIFWRHIGLRFLNEAAFMLVNALDPGIYITDYGPEFSGMLLYRGSSLANTCGNNCYFQGVGAGIDTFFPFRFIVDNPDRESPEPFLVIDLFRIGLSAATSFRNLENAFDLDVPIGGGVRVGARAFKIFEFMKIRAVKHLDDYVKDYSEGMRSIPKLMFAEAKKQFVESMEPGDTMILSSYLGVHGRIRYAPLLDVSLVSPQVGIKGETALISRVTIHKEDEQNMLAHWGKINYAKLKAAIGLKIGLNVDFLSAETKKEKSSGKTYVFDFQDNGEKQQLMQNLQAFYPKDIPDSYTINKRIKHLKQNRYNMGFLTLVKSNTFHRKIEIDLYDYLHRSYGKELSYENEKFHSLMKGLNFRTRRYHYKASVNEKNEPFVRIGLNIKIPEARKKHFLKTLLRIDPLVPEDFIVFDPYAAKEYWGELEFHSLTVLSDRALAIIFASDPYKMYEDYEDHQIAKPHPHRFKEFVRDFEKAREKYLQLKQYKYQSPQQLHAEREEIFLQLKEILTIFTKYNQKIRLLRHLRQMLPKDSYYQEARLISTLNGIPVDEDEILISNPSRGEFHPQVRHLVEIPEDVFEIFCDDLHQRINRFFYTPTGLFL